MGRLYETLRRLELQRSKSDPINKESLQPFDVLNRIMAEPAEMEGTTITKVEVTPKARLVSITDPRGLGAEKFRALATRLQTLRKERDFKSLQITSALVNEGKSLVAANLAVTLASYVGARVLLFEGDLHRPTLASLFGLGQREGVGQWWSARQEKECIWRYVCRLEKMSLWFLSAGAGMDQPSQILQSARFAETFVHLASCFDWVVVDSTPMMPMVDANLWLRLVDGTLLVVREGVTATRALKKGLASLDKPKFVGIVLNEASEFDHTNYADQYYALRADQKNRH